MAIKYLHPPSGEFATKEAWRWVAIYKEEDTYSRLEQFETKAGKAIFHRFAEIDQRKLESFVMENDSLPPLTLAFNPDTMELVHFYRNQHLERFTGGKDDQGNALVEKRNERMYYFGYKDKHGVYHLTGILPDGRLVITDDHELVVDPTQ